MTTYVVYRGDEVVAHGTAEECAEAMGVRPETVRWLSTPAARRRGLLTVAERVEE